MEQKVMMMIVPVASSVALSLVLETSHLLRCLLAQFVQYSTLPHTRAERQTNNCEEINRTIR